MSMSRQRESQRAARMASERKRDAGWAAVAVLFHVLLILLIPGFANPTISEKVIHLALQIPTVERSEMPLPPAPIFSAGTGDLATSPTIDQQVRPDAPPLPLKPTTKHSGKDTSERKPAAASPKPSQQPSDAPAPNTPAKKPQASPSSSSAAKDASDSTDVVVREQIAAKPKDKPKDNSQPAKKGESAKPNSGDKGKKPQPGKGDGGGGSDKQDQGPAPQNTGNASPGDPAPSAPKDGDPKGNGDGSGAPSGGGPTTAPNSGPPEPAGPTAAELDLLGDYGDGLKKKIRQMARTPEIAREKKHEGPVKFSFTVNQRGKLLDVSVISSPGYNELDEECREATRVASGSFPPFPKNVTTVEKWTFTMTLTFPLY
jgi:TonB family protein